MPSYCDSSSMLCEPPPGMEVPRGSGSGPAVVELHGPDGDSHRVPVLLTMTGKEFAVVVGHLLQLDSEDFFLASRAGVPIMSERQLGELGIYDKCVVEASFRPRGPNFYHR